MNLGEELKVDRPPKKYERNWGILVDLLPVILACVMVCLLTWSKMKDSTMEQKNIILMFSATCAAVLMIAAAAFYASRRAARKTYIRVCRMGISGVAQVAGIRNQEFSLPYGEIRKVNTRADQLVITTREGKLTMPLQEFEETKDLIRSLMG